jgi:hypothetical protein
LILVGVAVSVLAGLYAVRPRLELKAGGMGPLLPLEVKTGEPSFLGAAVRDPEALRFRPEDEQDATRLAHEIKEFRGDLARAKGERALELNEQAYQGYAALAYFLEDVAAGAASGDRNRARENLDAVRVFIVQHATAAAKLSKSERQRARAIFHALTAQYLLGRERGRAVQGLRDLSSGKLAKALESRAELLVAMHDLESGRDKRAAARRLAGAAKAIGGAGGVAARLAAARGYAGLGKDGRKLGRPDKAYRVQLAAAANAAQGLPAAQKDETLALILGIWRRAEGDGEAWSKVPFKMGAFADSPAVKGVIERSALADVRKGDLAAALRKYEGLAKSSTGQPLRGELDLRVLDLRRIEYAKSKNPKAYEATLLAKQKAYLDPGLLGEGNEARTKATAAEIRTRHGSLVYGEMARVATKSAKNVERSRAISLAETFLATLDDKKEIEGVKERIAQLHVLSGQHREAVALYRELAETGSNAKKYYGLAIASQSVLARWPAEAPWRGIPTGDASAREELLGLYGKYDQAAGGAGWPVQAHQGLLMSALGQGEQAFALWTSQLKKDGRGPHAAHAAGFMLVAYQKSQSWGELESLARLCLAGKVGPLYRGAPVSAHDSLGLALLEGGSQALEASQFPVAVRKLAEFVAQHGKSARHDEGMFKLAHAYHGNNQHKESISTLTAFVERHPRSRYLRGALLAGGDWAAPMAYEENTMFFYGRFLAGFGEDPEADRVRVTLTELYIGRGMYLDATAMLMARVRTPGVSVAEKSQALASVLDIEERHGSLARADKAADLLIAASDATPEHKAEAYALKARMAAKKSDYPRVRQIDAQLAGLGGSFAVSDAQGQARYLIATGMSQNLVQEHFNLELRDPLKTLSQRYAAWKQVRAAYDAVCEAGETSYCAPAMHDMARLAVQFLRSIEDIDIQATLAKEVVAKFRSHKQFVYNDVAKAAQRADSRAVASVRKGQSSPDTTQAILWQNSSDWNFDRVSGEAGNAYVQWSTRTAAEAE